MAKFIKSKFKVLWGTVFSFFYGFSQQTALLKRMMIHQTAEESAKRG